MSTESTQLEYPYDSPPPFGTTQEVAPGVRWLQMPLPMSLKYINLYLIEDEDGWTIPRSMVKSYRERIKRQTSDKNRVHTHAPGSYRASRFPHSALSSFLVHEFPRVPDGKNYGPDDP